MHTRQSVNVQPTEYCAVQALKQHRHKQEAMHQQLCAQRDRLLSARGGRQPPLPAAEQMYSDKASTPPAQKQPASPMMSTGSSGAGAARLMPPLAPPLQLPSLPVAMLDASGNGGGGGSSAPGVWGETLQHSSQYGSQRSSQEAGVPWNPLLLAPQRLRSTRRPPIGCGPLPVGKPAAAKGYAPGIPAANDYTPGIPAANGGVAGPGEQPTPSAFMQSFGGGGVTLQPLGNSAIQSGPGHLELSLTYYSQAAQQPLPFSLPPLPLPTIGGEASEGRGPQFLRDGTIGGGGGGAGFGGCSFGGGGGSSFVGGGGGGVSGGAISSFGGAPPQQVHSKRFANCAIFMEQVHTLAGLMASTWSPATFSSDGIASPLMCYMHVGDMLACPCYIGAHGTCAMPC